MMISIYLGNSLVYIMELWNPK